MNYLSHLRGFKLRRAENPLNTQELALYFILCEYANELYFPKSYTAANSVLQGLSGLSLSALKRARAGLQRKGYISYQNGYANQAGRYALISLETYGRAPEKAAENPVPVQREITSAKPRAKPLSETTEPQAGPQSGPHAGRQSGRQANRSPDTLNKPNKTKEKKPNPSAEFSVEQVLESNGKTPKEKIISQEKIIRVKPFEKKETALPANQKETAVCESVSLEKEDMTDCRNKVPVSRQADEKTEPASISFQTEDGAVREKEMRSSDKRTETTPQKPQAGDRRVSGSLTKEEIRAFQEKYPNISEDQIWYLARRLKQETIAERRETANVCTS